MQNISNSGSTNIEIHSTTETVIRVLCVDDETPLLETTKSILELQSSFHIETASSVDEALQKISGKDFDVIVSDYQMPIKSGLDFLKELRDSKNNIPFILFTGKGREEVAVKALNLGADRYFNKIGHPETVYGELGHGITQLARKKRVEREVKRLSSVIEQSSNAIVILDKTEKIVYVNPRFLQFHGLQFGEVVGTNWNRLIAEGTPLKENIENIRNVVFNQKAVWSKEIINKFNGKTYWIRAKIFPLVDEQNKVTHVVYNGEDITKLKRNEQKIWDREERLRAIIGSSPDAMIITDLHGNLIDCNIETLKLLEVSSRKEIMGDHCCKFIVKEELKNVREKIQELLEHGAINNVECKLLTIKGSRIDLEFSANTLRDSFGNPVGAVILARDITERKKVADAIKKSEQKYRNIVELSPDGIVTMSMKGIVTSANNAALDMIDFSKDDIVGKHFTKMGIFRLRDVPKYVKLVSSIFRGNKNQITEFVYLRKDGTERFGNAYISLLEENGKKIGLQAILRDITEERNIQQALQESEEKYRNIVEMSPDGMISTDTNGIVTAVNRAILEQTGFAQTDFVGKHFTQLEAVPTEFLPQLTKKINSFFSGEIPDAFEICYCNKDGAHLYAEATVGLLTNNNKVVGLQLLFRDITERKKTEKKHSESERRFRELTEFFPEIIFEYDVNRKLTYINHEAYTKFGYSKKEFEKGINVFEMMSPESKDKAQKNFVKILSGKKLGPNEYKLIRKDGTTFPAIITSTAIIQDNEAVGIRGVLVDITEQQKIKDNLRRERDTFEKVTGNLSATLVIISKDLRILWTNKYLSNILGDITGKVCHSALNRLDHICPGCKIQEVIETGKQTVFEMKVPNPEGLNLTEGNDLFLEITAIPIKDKDGKVTEILELALDITERKNMEKAIFEAEEKHRVLIDSANVFITSVDKKGKYIYVNNEWKRVFGYSDEDIKKITILDTVRSDHKKNCQKDIQSVTNGKTVADIETVFVTKNGKEIHARGNAKPIISNGKVISTVAVFLDITEHKKTENKIKETLKKMGKINEKLSVVGKLTRHDTRNKLSTIVNSTYLAKTQIDNKESAIKHLENIDGTIDQIEKILEFSRIYEMLGTQERTTINVKTILDEAFMLASQSCEIELVNDCEELTVQADSLLRQVFYNLIENSAKHGEKVSQIKVCYKKEKTAVKIIFTDNGIGIPENEKEQIFSEGYGKGSGYGLYLIRKICDEYGWTITENGELGKGAKFVINIPK